MSIAGVAAKKKGLEKINIIRVEGEHNKIPLLKNHLTINNLRPDTEDLDTTFNGFNIWIYERVINSDGASVEFPDVQINKYGASILEGTILRNVYGIIIRHGYSFDTISSKL